MFAKKGFKHSKALKQQLNRQLRLKKKIQIDAAEPLPANADPVPQCKISLNAGAKQTEKPVPRTMDANKDITSAMFRDKAKALKNVTTRTKAQKGDKSVVHSYQKSGLNDYEQHDKKLSTPTVQNRIESESGIQ